MKVIPETNLMKVIPETNLMKVIPETRRAHQILYLRVYQMSNCLFVVSQHTSINQGIIYPIAQYE
jgi:hypothetical protein